MAKPRKILDYGAPYLSPLVALIKTQSKTTLANWCLNYCEKYILPIYKEKYSDDTRLSDAIRASRDWLKGAVKLPQAKAEILLCHAAARETDDPAAKAAARAVGQCASAIHSARHCLGLPLYGALALAYYKLGVDASWERVEERAATECKHMEEALRLAAVKDEKTPAKQTGGCKEI